MTDRQTDGQTDGIAIASTAPAVRALRRAVKSSVTLSWLLLSAIVPRVLGLLQCSVVAASSMTGGLVR